MRLNKKLVNVIAGGIISISLLLLGKINSYFSVLILIFLGLNLSSRICKKLPYRVSFAGALGISILVITAYILSILNIGLSALIYLIPVLSTLTFNFEDYKEISRDDLSSLGKLFLIVGLLTSINILVFKMPTDTVDSVAHAYKIQYILKYNTMFPPIIPVFDLLSYPGGYHVLVAWITMLSKDLIPHSMLIARVWSWIFIIMGTYLLGEIWFGEGTGTLAAMVILVTNIYHYFLTIYIHPNFLSFYFFMCSLSLFYLATQNSKFERAPKTMLILLGTTTIFIHPYMFQAYVFIATVYLLLKLYSRDLHFKQTFLVGIKYFVTPVVIYAILNPYFWWPELASKVVIEYPWAMYHLTAKNLALMKGKPPSDNWDRFQFTMEWIFLRNNAYIASLSFLAGLILPLSNKTKVRETISLGSFIAFVMLLIINRITFNVPVPLYGSASMERMFLWISPLFPIFMSLGFNLLFKRSQQMHSFKMINVLKVAFLIGLFLIPAKGIAYDMISNEANYFVDQHNLDDFKWINERFSGITILNSCYTDAGQWIPFFTSNKVLFSYLNRCRMENLTVHSLIATINEKYLPNITLAYIDTNYPSLDPLVFYHNFKLLRYNNGNWIFDLTSHDTSKNEDTLRAHLTLHKDSISGNTYEDGKYYVYGFRKKYFLVEYLHLEGAEYAWLEGEEGVIMFIPSSNYTKMTISFICMSSYPINITISINEIKYDLLANPGENFYELSAEIQPDTLNSVKIIKERGIVLLISSIEFKK